MVSSQKDSEMLNSDLFQNGNLPYWPLPQAAYNAAHAWLLRLNFPETAILNDYSFSARSRNRTIKINALTFAHPVHRNPAEYASFTLYNAVNGLSDEQIVPILAESSAPFHLIHRDGQFAFWASAFRDNELIPTRIEAEISYDQLDSALHIYADDLVPQRIINAKQGRDTFTHPKLRELRPRQLSFWAMEVTRPLLVKYFSDAVDTLRNGIGTSLKMHISERVDDVIDLAVQLLGAVILADTGVLGDILRTDIISLNELITEAQSKFYRYFQTDLFVKYWDSAVKAYELLREIRYSNFTPDMLTQLMMAAHSEEQRKELGSFDTPLYLTRHIWENIPVEYLPPEQRYVADMTCGWGSFLIAGHERLANLNDTQAPLREYLRGNDIDFDTSRFAGLGLLLSTSEDSWHIDNTDAMQWDWLGTHQPGIIVGNPPFEGYRGTTGTSTTALQKAKRHQKADAFLLHAIRHLAPGGYLAMVMPRSFTAAEASYEIRRDLLQYCDVLELWQVPKVFANVNPQAIVIFAQKKLERNISHSPVRVRTIQKATQKDFQEVGIFTASQITTDQSTWNEILYKSEGSDNTHIMEYNLALSNSTWQRINEQCIKLHECADIFRGAIVGSRRRYATTSNPKQIRWLTNARKMLRRPFSIDYEYPPQIKLYPNDFEEPRLNKKHIFEDSKVLVVHSPYPSWGKRAKVAIERKGYYVSGSFWIVSPLPDAEKVFVTNEVLAAILSWDVSNAWLIERMTSLGIPEYAMNTIPFPKNLSQNECEALNEAVLKLEAAANADQIVPLEATQTIDTILKAAYNLDDATFERLRKISEWDSNPQTTLDPIPDADKSNWILSGVVDSINAEEGTITLWMEGFEELQTVQIAASMPGWMLRPGAAFRTKIPREHVKDGFIRPDTIDWGIFHAQSYTYMTEEELLAELSSILQEDDRNRIG